MYICEKLFNMNLHNDKDFQKRKLQKGYKRLALVSSIWALISSPFLFWTNQDAFFPVIGWLTWCIIGILLSPKIVNRIWK